MHFPDRSVLLVAARVMWAFDTVSAEGEDIIALADPETAYHHRAVGSPKPLLV